MILNDKESMDSAITRGRGPAPGLQDHPQVRLIQWAWLKFPRHTAGTQQVEYVRTIH